MIDEADSRKTPENAGLVDTVPSPQSQPTIPPVEWSEIAAPLVDHVSDVLFALSTGAIIVALNQTFETLTGWSRQRWIGQSFKSLIHPIDLPRAQSVFQEVLANHVPGPFEIRVLLRSGDFALAEITPIPWLKAGIVIGVLGIARNIGERRRLENELSALEAHYRAAVDDQAEAICRFRTDGVITDVNPALCRAIGVERDQIVGTSFANRIPKDELASLAEHLASLRMQSPVGVVRLRLATESGDLKWLEWTIRAAFEEDGRLLEYHAVGRDVTNQKTLEDALDRLTYQDKLTGLYNRAYLLDELKQLQSSSQYPITVFSVDVEGLDLINDTLGQRSGDQVLVTCSEFLTSMFRLRGVVTRSGGDSFAVVLPRTDSRLANEIRHEMESKLEIHNRGHRDLPLALAIGKATAFAPDVPLEDVMRWADRNMNQDKLRRSGSQDIIRAWMTSLSTKDYVLDGHVRRVLLLVRWLGQSAGLSGKDLADLELLAAVHDLGKVGIPDHVLSKETPLTDGEREEMRQHPLIGYRIARAAPGLSHIAGLILHHHEWWNGQGYPMNLSGEDIPISCRILAVADAYDAMINDRPYRPAMAHEDAIGELTRGAGEQFDPDLVAKFVEVVGDGSRLHQEVDQ